MVCKLCVCIYIYIYIYLFVFFKVVHHGSPILQHGYVHLGKYLILSRQVYMNFGIINHDKRLTKLIFHYIQGLPRSKCPRQDSNPGGECNNQISQPPELRPMDIYIYIWLHIKKHSKLVAWIVNHIHRIDGTKFNWISPKRLMHLKKPISYPH